MKQLINYVLLFVTLLLLSCNKDDEVIQSELPSMSDPNDVCSAMDDINFMKYCYDNFDVNKDGKVSLIEAEAVTEIKVSGIKSLKGIEYFSNLESLDCSKSTSLQKLDNISWNIKLSYLNCYYCSISSLDVSGNKELEILNCDKNNISSLDVSNNKKLHNLICSRNNLTSLDVANNKELRTLSCSDNSLTKLDVSNNVQLTSIRCSNTNIEILDASNLSELSFLDCLICPLLSEIIVKDIPNMYISVGGNVTITYVD